jgi:hypothetical protein
MAEWQRLDHPVVAEGGLLAITPARTLDQRDLDDWGGTFGAKAGECVVVPVERNGVYEVEGRFCSEGLCEIRVRLHQHEDEDEDEGS